MTHEEALEIICEQRSELTKISNELFHLKSAVRRLSEIDLPPLKKEEALNKIIKKLLKMIE